MSTITDAIHLCQKDVVGPWGCHMWVHSEAYMSTVVPDEYIICMTSIITVRAATNEREREKRKETYKEKDGENTKAQS